MIMLKKSHEAAITIIRFLILDDELTASEMAEVTGMPYHTISKVCQSLKKNGLLNANRGKVGGYSLRVPGEDLSVWDVITASTDVVSRKCIFQTINNAIRQTLDGIYIKDL